MLKGFWSWRSRKRFCHRMFVEVEGKERSYFFRFAVNIGGLLLRPTVNVDVSWNQPSFCRHLHRRCLCSYLTGVATCKDASIQSDSTDQLFAPCPPLCGREYQIVQAHGVRRSWQDCCADFQTWYLSFFLHKCTFGKKFSPHESTYIVAKKSRQNSVNNRFSNKTV